MPDDALVVRYGAPTKWQSLKKENNWRAFDLRRLQNGRLEPGLSIPWYERFHGPLEEQLNQVRQRARLNHAASGKLLEILVCTVKFPFESNHELRALATLEFIRDPLPPKQGLRPDKTPGMVKGDGSHSLIKGMEVLDESHRKAVADFLARCVLREFPA